MNNNLKIEIINVGNELLTGKVVNSNSSWICHKLFSYGLNCQFITVVPDKKEDIISTIKIARKRSNILIITGGLGPTFDDLTMEAIADSFNTPLILNEEIEEKIKKRFDDRKIKMVTSNLKQALIPKGGMILNNPSGTAPGLLWELKKEFFTIIALPGVPDEMKDIWNNSLEKYFKKKSKLKIYEKYMNFIGISESTLMEKVRELNICDTNIFPYASNFQVSLHIFKKGNDLNILKKGVDNTIDILKSNFAIYNYSFDNQNIVEVVAELLKNKKLTISLAESCTGGLVSSKLTDISGSSEYISLNMVTYANEKKSDFLKIDKDLIEKYGAVSKETAQAMAEGIRKVSKTDIGVGVTGIAGPTGGSREKPVGLVWIGITDGKNYLIEKKYSGSYLNRIKTKEKFSIYVIDAIRRFLIK